VDIIVVVIVGVGGAEGAAVDLLFCWVGISSGRYGDEDDGAEE